VSRFANSLIGILLAIEVVNTCVWLVGVNIISAADGTGLWKRISIERADRLCYVDGLLNFWL
jgi:hypothetical protein